MPDRQITTYPTMIESMFGYRAHERVIERTGFLRRNHERRSRCRTPRVIRKGQRKAPCATRASRFASADPTRPGPRRDPSLSSRSGLSSLRDVRKGLGMRINYEIPDDLHHRAKALAALEGRTLREFIVEALTEAVARREADGNATGGESRRG